MLRIVCHPERVLRVEGSGWVGESALSTTHPDPSITHACGCSTQDDRQPTAHPILVPTDQPFDSDSDPDSDIDSPGGPEEKETPPTHHDTGYCIQQTP